MRSSFLALSIVAAALAGCDRGSDSAASATPSAGTLRSATPRHPDGQVRFDSEPGNRGYWGQASVSSLFEKGVQVAMDEQGLAREYRRRAARGAVSAVGARPLRVPATQRPEGRPDACVHLAPSGPRHLHTAGGFRIIRDPTYDRMYILFGGGNRNWRIVFMDGRRAAESRGSVRHVFRSSERALGRRHAGRRVERLQRALLVLERRAAAHGGVAPHGAFLAAGLRHVEIRSDRRRSADVHASVDRGMDGRLGWTGKRSPSSFAKTIAMISDK